MDHALRTQIVLIGLRGAGKTTAGRALAARLDCPFHDLDDLVLAHLGAPSVRSVFEGPGEATWRAAEGAVVGAYFKAERPPSILALGGGAPMLEAVRSALGDAKTQRPMRVIYLDCPVSLAAERLTRTPGDRTSLTGRGIAEELAGLAALRAPVYRALADHIVEASGDSASVVEQLIAVATGGARRTSSP